MPSQNAEIITKWKSHFWEASVLAKSDPSDLSSIRAVNLCTPENWNDGAGIGAVSWSALASRDPQLWRNSAAEVSAPSICCFLRVWKNSLFVYRVRTGAVQAVYTSPQANLFLLRTPAEMLMHVDDPTEPPAGPGDADTECTVVSQGVSDPSCSWESAVANLGDCIFCLFGLTWPSPSFPSWESCSVCYLCFVLVAVPGTEHFTGFGDLTVPFFLLRKIPIIW